MPSLIDLEAEIARRIATLQAEAAEARRARPLLWPARRPRPSALTVAVRPAGPLAGKEAA